ncbi:YibE/F family protein [Actinoalloteichus hymeniacidonis]|uniref:YibE/F family protein n=1 Tax=Actinoalloteichus hymeniacidonis TaxID=340345 RepID=UPI000A920BED|nr:YibE/F family protein [Actinoalloteichus hymeniacidonis]MBB5909043.1 putative membrane protein [Actinoalloteichus hymeniacidonis]
MPTDPGDRTAGRRTGRTSATTAGKPARRERRTAEAVGHGHGHGHGHGPAGRSSTKVRILLAALLVPVALATVIGALLLHPFGQETQSSSELGFFQEPFNAEVLSAEVGGCQSGGAQPVPGGTQPDPGGADPGGAQPDPNTGAPQDDSQCQVLQVRLDDGEAAGQTIEQVLPLEPSTPTFEQGDQVVLSYTGAQPTEPSSYRIVDFQRGGSLLWLAVLFSAAVLLLARWKGLTALAGLAVSFAIITMFIIPAILAGENAVTVAVIGSGLIMFVVLYLTHGFSARTSAAVLGTLISLALIAVLGIVFSELTKLTGLDEETVNLITILGTDVDARGLLLAGVIIGALGVLDDMTISQTSAVWELRKANPTMGWGALYTAGVRIGRDHISAAVNTLALAYAGAALPLLLSYSLSGVDLGTLFGAQVVAQEIVRTLVGSIGLVAAVPISTALAALVVTRGPTEPTDDHDPVDPPDPVYPPDIEDEHGDDTAHTPRREASAGTGGLQARAAEDAPRRSGGTQTRPPTTRTRRDETEEDPRRADQRRRVRPAQQPPAEPDAVGDRVARDPAGRPPHDGQRRAPRRPTPEDRPARRAPHGGTPGRTDGPRSAAEGRRRRPEGHEPI